MYIDSSNENTNQVSEVRKLRRCLDILVDFGIGDETTCMCMCVLVCGDVGIDRVPALTLSPAGPDQSSQVVVVVCMSLSV